MSNGKKKRNSPWDIISILTLCSPSVENMRPAIPIMFFISAPTRLRIAMCCSVETSPHSSSSLMAASKWEGLESAEWMAMETCTSDVEMRSTLMQWLLRMANTRAKKPCDMDRLFECTLMTAMLSLMVTAVGRLGVFRLEGSDGRERLICL